MDEQEAQELRDLAVQLRKLASEFDAYIVWSNASYLLQVLDEVRASGGITAGALATALYRSIDSTLERAGHTTSETPVDIARQKQLQAKFETETHAFIKRRAELRRRKGKGN